MTWIFITIFLGTAIGCIAQTAGIPADYTHGIAAYQSGDYAVAANLLARAEQESPGSTNALLVRSRALMALNRFAEAETAARAYAVSHADADGWYQLGRIEFVVDKPKASLAAMTNAARDRTPGSEDLRIVGLDYVLLNDYKDAAHWLETAVAGNGQNADLWYELGRVRYTLAQYEQAGDAFQHALAMEPHHVNAAANLGLVYESENKIEKAIAVYREAIAWQAGSDKKSAQPFLFLGTLLCTLGDTEEATRLLRQAVQITPRDAAAHGELGHAYVQQNKLEPGRGELEQAVSLSPDQVKWHFQLGRVYQTLGMQTSAKKEFAISARLSTSSTAKYGGMADGRSATNP